MDADKKSGYQTLFDVLQTYMLICASFAPFVSEHIYLELQKFSGKEEQSVHLKHLPLFSTKYIDEKLIEEIAMVRRVISLGLFIRSKNKIAIKQPLQTIEIKIE